MLVTRAHGSSHRWANRSTGGKSITNMAYGGLDNRDLFMSESDTGRVLRVRLDVPGKLMFSHQIGWIGDSERD